MKGVIWNDIFSASLIIACGLDLAICNSSVHGSTLMRAPSGRAAVAVGLGFASDCSGEDAAPAMFQLVGTRSPRCGLTRLGNCFDRFWSAWRKTFAVSDDSLYGEFLNSSLAFCCAACSSALV